ncbi:dihydrodipicolinate synthase family protein [Xenophilus azovorans]|uniref:dihydrodipicolinate synthase family protein n=1 Tax=Xenophilus azovorans TaxID=151755 RepID=UPI00056E6AC1|nr:dihydrodipicolinate synthase family protein [Xenophilus azovorans]
MKDLSGIIIPVVTPFDAAGDIDESAMRGQVRFMIEKGVHGICVGGTTGEGHTLSKDDLRKVATIAVDEAAGRIPVLAGVFANSTQDLVARGKALSDVKLDALQVTPTYYLYNPNDESMLAHYKALTDAVDFPVIIYNVVRWNILGADLLVRIMTENDKVVGVKQSGGEIKLLADLLVRAPKGKLIYSAQDSLLYPTFMLGAHGAIAASPAAAPTAALALWEAVKAGDHEFALKLHKGILRLWNALTGNNCPAAVKYALSLQGCPTGLPRMPMHPATPQQQAAIKGAVDAVLDIVASGPSRR